MMTRDEAVAECHRWFEDLERQRKRARLMQNAATLARCGDTTAARHLRDQVDRMPRVYDCARLEEAVRVLIDG